MRNDFSSHDENKHRWQHNIAGGRWLCIVMIYQEDNIAGGRWLHCDDLPGGLSFSVVNKNSQALIQPNRAQHYPTENLPAVGVGPWHPMANTKLSSASKFFTLLIRFLYSFFCTHSVIKSPLLENWDKNFSRS